MTTSNLAPQSGATAAYEADVCVFIGRFQPVHDGHLAVIRAALQKAKFLVIVVGSANEPRRPDYLPFTAEERIVMLRMSLTDEENDRVLIVTAEDSAYNTKAWLDDVHEKVYDAAKRVGFGKKATIRLIGHSKDKSSFYLALFPAWTPTIEVPNHLGLSATPFRLTYFSDDVETVNRLLANAAGLMPAPVLNWLDAFRQKPAYADMVEEWTVVRKGREAWKDAPYPPVFVTVDAVLVQCNHILLVKRRAHPGKGLWALPGGFIEQDETVLDGTLRELREETGLKVPAKVLKGNIVETRVFDHPFRSSRGRTITHATFFHLCPEVPIGPTPEEAKKILALPKVKGQDDAEEARWFDLREVERHMMFEDHFAIIKNLTAKL